jgi:hypothetical protein
MDCLEMTAAEMERDREIIERFAMGLAIIVVVACGVVSVAAMILR